MKLGGSSSIAQKTRKTATLFVRNNDGWATEHADTKELANEQVERVGMEVVENAAHGAEAHQ
jgi:hypothetical protein